MKPVRGIVAVLALAIFMLSSAGIAHANSLYRASEHGVVADGRSDNAEAIQAMIDACADKGGGTVLIDGGTVASGMIELKSNVSIEIAEGATLKCTGSADDYPYVPVDFITYYPERRAMIYARGRENIAVVGKGTIDGSASDFKWGSSESARVSLIRFDECRDAEVRDITLVNASMWTQHFNRTDKLKVSGIKVRNHFKNDDGLNIDGCHGVRISDCDIIAHDDAITMKNTSHRATRDVVVSDCRLESKKSAFKFGTESYEGFIDIVARDLKIIGGRDAIALFSSDGARIENVLIEDIEIVDTRCPIFVLLGTRLRPIEGDSQELEIGSVQGVTLRNIRAKGCIWAAMLLGNTEKRASDILLENIDIDFAQFPGGRKNGARGGKDVGEGTGAYPKSNMFGNLNAWGLFVRHVEDAVLRDIVLKRENEGQAHMAYFEDVRNLTVDKLQAPTDGKEPHAWVEMKNVRDIDFDMTWPGDSPWISVLDGQSGNVTIESSLPARKAMDRIKAPNGTIEIQERRK